MSIINQILEKCREEMNKDECDSVIKKDLINPIINYMGKKMMPYIWFSIFILSVVIAFIIVCCVYVYMRYCDRTVI